MAFVIRTLVSDGFAVNPDTQEIYMQPYKYLTNFIGQLFIINIINEIERSQHTGKEEDSQSKNNIPNVGQCIQSVSAISPMTDYRHNGICHIGLII